MTQFRKIQPHEIPEARKRFHKMFPWAAEPAWDGVYGKFVDGVVVAFFGVQYRYIIEPLYAESPRDALEMVVRADTMLMNEDYEFYVDDRNEKFQKFLERQGVEGIRQDPGKFYMIKRTRDAQ